MLNGFADWLFNVLFLGAIAGMLVLGFHVYAAPILGGVTALVALVVVLVLSALWPKW